MATEEKNNEVEMEKKGIFLADKLKKCFCSLITKTIIQKVG